MFIVRRILVQRYKFPKPITACFIILRGTFDFIDRQSLWCMIRNVEMLGKYVMLLNTLYLSTQTYVRAFGKEFSELPLDSCVRQGCPLSPILITQFIGWTLLHAFNNFRGILPVGDCWATDLKLADNIVLLDEEFTTLQSVLDRIVYEAMSVDLEINTS